VRSKISPTARRARLSLKKRSGKKEDPGKARKIKEERKQLPLLQNSINPEQD